MTIPFKRLLRRQSLPSHSTLPAQQVTPTNSPSQHAKPESVEPRHEAASSHETTLRDHADTKALVRDPNKD